MINEIFVCLLYSTPPIRAPDSHPLPRCRRCRKWARTGLFRAPMMPMRTREHPSTSGRVRGSSPGAWPMRTATPRCGVPANLAFLAPWSLRAPFLSRSPCASWRRRHFCLFFRLRSTVWPFSAECTPVLTRQRPPTNGMAMGGAPGARPTLRGPSHVLHPGRRRLLGRNSVSATAFRTSRRASCFRGH